MVSITSKIVMCGDYAVGKTTFVQVFLGGEAEKGYRATIGVDIGKRVFKIGVHKIVFQIWDLGAEKRYDKLREIYYQGTRGAFLLDATLQVLGKVPVSELSSTLSEIEADIYALVLDGGIDKDLVSNARQAGVQLIIGKEIASDIGVTKVKLVLAENL